MTDTLEEQKLTLEISEIESKLRWEPIKILGTFLGIAVVLIGLGVERWADANRQGFEIERAQHDREIDAMTGISEVVGGLCARTHAVIRQHETKEVFEGAMIESLIDSAKELGEAARDPAERKKIELIATELERTKTAIFDELTEYGHWVRAVELEAEWRRRTRAPRADFTRYFDEDLLPKWRIVFQQADEGIRSAFNFFGDGAVDLEQLTASCMEFQSQLYVAMETRTKTFCVRYNDARAC